MVTEDGKHFWKLHPLCSVNFAEQYADLQVLMCCYIREQPRKLPSLQITD